MQNKDLHKLGKTDLFEIIYEQKKEIETLQEKIKDLNNQLEDRSIRIKEAGSIAEASLKINEIFEIAQKAADEYINSIKEQYPNKSQDYVESKSVTNDNSKKEREENNIKQEYGLILVQNQLAVPKEKLLYIIVKAVLQLYAKLRDFLKRLIVNSWGGKTESFSASIFLC